MCRLEEWRDGLVESEVGIFLMVVPFCTELRRFVGGVVLKNVLLVSKYRCLDLFELCAGLQDFDVDWKLRLERLDSFIHVACWTFFSTPFPFPNTP